MPVLTVSVLDSMGLLQEQLAFGHGVKHIRAYDLKKLKEGAGEDGSMTDQQGEPADKWQCMWAINKKLTAAHSCFLNVVQECVLWPTLIGNIQEREF